MHCVISRPLTRQDHRAGGSMKERPDPWLISSCGLREKQRKATQVTFRQVSVGGPAQAEVAKCKWVPFGSASSTTLHSVLLETWRRCSHYAPSPSLEIQLRFTTHELLGPVATRPWNRFYDVLSNACSNSLEALTLYPLHPQSSGNERETMDSLHKNHHIYIFLSWAQWMILIKPFLKRIEGKKGKMVNI